MHRATNDVAATREKFVEVASMWILSPSVLPSRHVHRRGEMPCGFLHGFTTRAGFYLSHVDIEAGSVWNLENFANWYFCFSCFSNHVDHIAGMT